VQIESNELEIQSKIAAGGFGIVFKALWHGQVLYIHSVRQVLAVFLQAVFQQ
jgi:hypothetical protein